MIKKVVMFLLMLIMICSAIAVNAEESLAGVWTLNYIEAGGMKIEAATNEIVGSLVLKDDGTLEWAGNSYPAIDDGTTWTVEDDKIFLTNGGITTTGLIINGSISIQFDDVIQVYTREDNEIKNGESEGGNLIEFDFTGKEEITQIDYIDLQFDYPWYVETQNLPDWVEDGNHGSPRQYSGQALTMEKSGKDNDEQFPTNCTLEFVSGNENLKNLISISKDTDGQAFFRLTFNFNQLLEPGDVTYRITLENDKRYYQQEKTLHVLSFKDNPPLLASGIPLVVYLRKGQNFSFYSTPKGYPVRMYALSMIFPEAEYNHALNSPINSKKGWAYEKVNLFEGIDGISFNGNDKYHVDKEGVYDAVVPLNYSNLYFDVHIRLVCSDKLYLNGPGELLPGETAQYAVDGGNAVYSFSVAGDGFSIDETTGALTVSPDVVPGSYGMITADPGDGGMCLYRTIAVKRDSVE